MKRAISAFLCAALLMATLPISAFAEEGGPSDAAAESSESSQTPVDESGMLKASDLLAETAVLIDAETGQVLFDKGMDTRMYPASTTKIMTGLLVVENTDPSEIATARASAIDPIPRYTSHISLDYDERLSVRDALYALMLPSANDAANVLAEHVAGSQEAFAAMMNERAQQIGATNTHFTNAHGLHDEAHYTTARDLALITQEAWRQGGLMPYMGTARYDMGPTNQQSAVRELYNQQYMVVPSMWVYNPDVLGGKVGFTDEARHTMSTVAEKNGRTLIAVVMNTKVDDKFYDTQMLLDYGFGQFAAHTVGAEELLWDAPAAYTASDTTVLLPTGTSAASLRVRVEDGGESAVAVIELDANVAGLPRELLRVPLTAPAQPVAAAARATPVATAPTFTETFLAVAGRIVRVLGWTFAVVLGLLLLLMLRRTMVIRKRRRLREQRMRRVQQQRMRQYR